jgi:hypothetical protein
MFEAEKYYEEYERYFSDPLWYLHFTPDMERLFLGPDPEDPKELAKFDAEKKSLRELCIKLYRDNKISFAKSGQDLDAQRLPIDTVVIHHTAGSADASWEYVNMQHLFSMYVAEYRNPKREYHGQPIWSNHLDTEGNMVFCAYHYLIWPDGRSKQMLKDEYIGWHCGNWEKNRSSVAVTFVGDLSETTPSTESIQSAKEIISKYPGTEILGHREILPTTICPGNKFLGDSGWKQELL